MNKMFKKNNFIIYNQFNLISKFISQYLFDKFVISLFYLINHVIIFYI